MTDNPLISLAAGYSQRAYEETNAAWEKGTTAMFGKCVSINGETKTIVLAIRGTDSLADWFVNLQMNLVRHMDFLVSFPVISL